VTWKEAKAAIEATGVTEDTPIVEIKIRTTCAGTFDKIKAWPCVGGVSLDNTKDEWSV
jgi:hypothetical protein